MMVRIVVCVLCIIGFFGKEPDFELLAASKCKWGQGRPEMGMAHEYEFRLENRRKVGKIQFQYLLLDGHFIPLSNAPRYDKIGRHDTIMLHAVHFKNRAYDVDSLYINHVDDSVEGLLFLYKDEPHVLKFNNIRYEDCPERRKRM